MKLLLQNSVNLKGEGLIMSVVRTNEKCIGCNKCIRACSCIGANIAVQKDGVNAIEVNPDKCIACGAL